MNSTEQPAVAGPVEPTVRPQDGDVAETLTKALRRAYHLGQTYWQQADSESYAQNRRADETARKFEALLGETTGALAAAVVAERERWRDAVLEMRGRLLWLDQRADTREVDALLLGPNQEVMRARVASTEAGD